MKMSTLKKIILSVILITSLSAFSKGQNTTKKIEKIEDLKTYVKKEVALPKSMLKSGMNEKVNVQFNVTENGTIEIQKIETNNSGLEKYIFNQLNGQILNMNLNLLNLSYQVAIKFITM